MLGTTLDFNKVLKIDDLVEGELTGITVAGTKVLLIKYQGQFVAYEDKCLHLGVPLSEGVFKKGTLTCKAHHWEYEIPSGLGLNPEGICLQKFDTKVQDGFIWVKIM